MTGRTQRSPRVARRVTKLSSVAFVGLRRSWLSKFAHMSDIHLGAHREPALRDLERKCFAEAMDMCVDQAVDFLLISASFTVAFIVAAAVAAVAVAAARIAPSGGAVVGSRPWSRTRFAARPPG